MKTLDATFYLIAGTKKNDALTACCPVVARLYQEKRTVYLHTSNQEDAEILDEKLWSFSKESFVPHNLTSEIALPRPPVQIGWNKPAIGCEILFYFTPQCPPFFAKFASVVTFIPNDEQLLIYAREQYRFFKKQNIAPITHDEREPSLHDQ